MEAVLALSGRQPQILLHNLLAGVVQQLEIVGTGHHAGQVVVRVHLHQQVTTDCIALFYLSNLGKFLFNLHLQGFVSSKPALTITETHLWRDERFLHDGERRHEQLEKPNGEARKSVTNCWKHSCSGVSTVADSST